MQVSYPNIKRLREAVMNRNVDEIGHCIGENAAVVNAVLEVCSNVWNVCANVIAPLP